MPNLESEIDAQFYEMIHRLSEGSGADLNERRREPRRPYEVLQKVAPYEGKSFPGPSEFMEVQCHDLTQAGFSFLFPCRPSFKSIVASFQGADSTLFFEAAVVRVNRALIRRDGGVEVFGSKTPPPTAAHLGAKPTLLVGCRFVRRLQPDGAGLQ